MSILDLTQHEADALFSIEKHCVDDTQYIFPGLGGALRIPLISADRKEEFILDITRGRIDLKKNTFQNRARKAIVLVRVDIEGPSHPNPDGEVIPCPHIHLYREGFALKWAHPIPSTFNDPSDVWDTLNRFQTYCNISKPPNIQRELFT